VVFWSDKCKHEVEPNHNTLRRSICLWYFDKDERLASLRRRDETGLDVSNEAAARSFINDLLVLQESSFAALKKKLNKDARKLGDASRKYVEKVLGIENLVQWIDGIEETQLTYQRSFLQHMGV